MREPPFPARKPPADRPLRTGALDAFGPVDLIDLSALVLSLLISSSIRSNAAGMKSVSLFFGMRRESAVEGYQSRYERARLFGELSVRLVSTNTVVITHIGNGPGRADPAAGFHMCSSPKWRTHRDDS